MERQPFDDSLRALQRRRPFRSFTVERVSDDPVEIDHPDSLVVRGGVVVYVSSRGTPTILDHQTVLRVVARSD